MLDDYSGFGKPVLDSGEMSDTFISENGAWYWHMRHHGRGTPQDPSHERLPLPEKRLTELRGRLRRALEIVERQIGEVRTDA